VANKMADKKKNISQSQMAEAKARTGEKEQSKTKAVAREQDEQERKNSRRDSKEQERKQSQSRKGPSATATRLRNNRLIRFVLEAYYELRHKVTWPTFEEARNMTIVVILLSAAVGIVLGAADLGLFQIFRLISGK
jgi:preprotein translocase SecE subunit